MRLHLQRPLVMPARLRLNGTDPNPWQAGIPVNPAEDPFQNSGLGYFFSAAVCVAVERALSPIMAANAFQNALNPWGDSMASAIGVGIHLLALAILAKGLGCSSKSMADPPVSVLQFVSLLLNFFSLVILGARMAIALVNQWS